MNVNFKFEFDSKYVLINTNPIKNECSICAVIYKYKCLIYKVKVILGREETLLNELKSIKNLRLIFATEFVRISVKSERTVYVFVLFYTFLSFSLILTIWQTKTKVRWRSGRKVIFQTWTSYFFLRNRIWRTKNKISYKKLKSERDFGKAKYILWSIGLTKKISKRIFFRGFHFL